MNPLKIDLYRSPATYTAFAGSRFVGYIIAKGKQWEGRPANSWMPHLFTSKEKAKRYLMATLKKVNGKFIDHINPDGLSNKKNNLKLCTRK